MVDHQAFVIGVVDEDRVYIGIQKAHHYGVQVAGAIKRTIRAIHGLEDLIANHDLKSLNIYLGRSSAAPMHVLNRWKAHNKKFSHKYATVLFVCDAGRAQFLEEIAIRVLAKLKGRGSLCVGNVNTAEDGRGRPPGNETAVVYMTWGIGGSIYEWEKPNAAIIKEVAGEVSQDMERAIPRLQLERGLQILKKVRTAKAKLAWSLP